MHVSGSQVHMQRITQPIYYRMKLCISTSAGDTDTLMMLLGLWRCVISLFLHPHWLYGL